MAELTTLARPYARAAFEVAVESESLSAWSKDLDLVSAVVGETVVKAALSSPSLTGEKQAQMVIDLCGDEISDGAKNFIAILADNKRIGLMREIVKLFETLKANQEKKVDVNITSAFELSEGIEAKLTASLKEKLQRDVILHSEIDSTLIGGAIIRAGDLVIDGSVRGKLSRLAEAMKS
ncbi:F0F1 ATP synthase subunit delta [Gammaproteobacteria bacterium]|nr:F0F1 ATP synthase subunit delta [Gammaproteobacteria bacterium]